MWTDKGDITGPFQHYRDVLTRYGCSDADILKLQLMWNEPHRVYHNQEHLEEILSLIEDYKRVQVDPIDWWIDALIMTAFFHDAVYDPMSKTNEEDSAALFFSMCHDNPNMVDGFEDIVNGAILDTKDHTKTPSSSVSSIFLKMDLNGLINGSLSRMISDEQKIMREFGFVDYGIYKDVRGTQFLDKFAPYVKHVNPNSQIDAYVDWFKHRTPNIAVFTGTFFPFHRGHNDILKRAERIFDKVIVLACVNPGKSNDLSVVKKYVETELRQKLPNNQVEFFDGMVHNYIKELSYSASVVKGLRNASDFDAEKLQLRYMEDMYPEINIVYIVSDRKFEHVSSSGIKLIQSMGANEEASKYLI